MGSPFPVKSAGELMDAEFLAKWMDRGAVSPLGRAVLGVILGRFAAEGRGPRVDDVPGLLPGRDAAGVREALVELDQRDLVLLQGGRVMLAYPFADAPTAFRAVLGDGAERHACCAVDALGIPALLGEPAAIHSHCHHCGEPLGVPVGPRGPLRDDGVMVWVGERPDLRQKACASL
jgi:hypothetical protein